MALIGVRGRIAQGVVASAVETLVPTLFAPLRRPGPRSRALIARQSSAPSRFLHSSSSRLLLLTTSSTSQGSTASSSARRLSPAGIAPGPQAISNSSFTSSAHQTTRMGSTVASLTLPRLPLFEAISHHDPKSTAVVHCLSGRSFTYGELLPDVYRARERLYDAAGRSNIEGERVAFLVENSYDYVVTFLAILAARAVALPLSPPFPAPELQYIISHAEALLFVHSPKFAAKVTEVLSTPWPEASPNPNPKVVEIPKHAGISSASGSNNSTYYEPVSLSEGSEAGQAAMMLYTSGTTNRPKGVLIPESALTAQSAALKQAWRYTPEDRLLHVLPLHHIHGTVNAVITPLLAGSTIEFLFPFNADAVWRRFANPFLPPSSSTDDAKFASMRREKITFFTVVPTVYTRLISTHKLLAENPATAEFAQACRKAVSPENMRVSISGSAALPTPVKRAWKDLSLGNVLLERYGMTEVGMALSCGLDFGDRIDGSVGWPLPGVQARLVETDEDAGTSTVILPGEETHPETGKERQGEIQLRGANVFREYWRNPAATAKEFVAADPSDPDQRKWFKTGDVAVRRPVPESATARGTSKSGDWVPASSDNTMYFILGRQSADIIKSGGEKVSALEVEREMLSLPEVSECAVLAVPSGKWGQKVGAVVILDKEFVAGGGSWKPMDMRRALKGRLANYKIPQVLRVVEDIPRNAMGKINKKELVKAVFRDDFSGDEM